MIDMRYKPSFLPQVSAPLDMVLEKLRDENVGYELIKANPNDLNPSQGITFSDDIDGIELDDMNPIWVGDDLNVLDGHHRYVKALMSNTPIMTVKIHMNDKDACRLLNKIQDIYEYENAKELEEHGTYQNTINTENDIDNNGSSRMNFISTLEETNAEIQNDEESTKNSKTIIAYRKDPIKENSAVGNFFTLEPVEGFNKYEIDFENLLDSDELGVSYKTDQNPIEILAKIWFPNINFEKLSESLNIEPINLKNKAIAEKAMSLGYDGIKYGSKIIQGLK